MSRHKRKPALKVSAAEPSRSAPASHIAPLPARAGDESVGEAGEAARAGGIGDQQLRSSTETGLLDSAVDYYLTPHGAQHYKDKYMRFGKRYSHRRECRILRRLLSKAGRVQSILDIPCGTGRFYAVTSEFADSVRLADLSPHMLQIARSASGNHASGYLQQNVFDLPSNGVTAEGILSVRIMHHLHDAALQRKYLETLAASASKWLVFSFLDSSAVKTRFRRFTRRMRGKYDLASQTLAEVREMMKPHGYRFVASMPVSGIFSGHRFVLFAKNQPTA